jgi:hypothetical protein
MHPRSFIISVLLLCALTLPLAGCGDSDNENIDIPGPTEPVRTATPNGNPTPVATPTGAGATATAAAPTATATTSDPVATPTPGADPCSAAEVVVETSLDAAYGAARIDVAYLGSLVNIPGSGPAQSVVERVDFAASGGLTTANDDDNTSTLTASLVGFAEQPAGLFATITFDCVAGSATDADFTCTVVSASTPGGVAIPGVGCSVAIQ